MDTDHPFFQTPAAEIEEDPTDEFLERVAARWRKSPMFTVKRALELVGEEHRKERRSRTEPPPPGQVISSVEMLRILAYIHDSATRELTHDAVCYCFGLFHKTCEPMEHVAQRNNISRQAFSKKVEKVQKDLKLSPIANMRTPSQKELYRRVHVSLWEQRRKDTFIQINGNARRTA